CAHPAVRPLALSAPAGCSASQRRDGVVPLRSPASAPPASLTHSSANAHDEWPLARPFLAGGRPGPSAPAEGVVTPATPPPLRPSPALSSSGSRQPRRYSDHPTTAAIPMSAPIGPPYNTPSL